MRPNYDLLLIAAMLVRGGTMNRTLRFLAGHTGFDEAYVANCLALMAERGHVQQKRETQEWPEVSAIALTSEGARWAVDCVTPLSPICPRRD